MITCWFLRLIIQIGRIFMNTAPPNDQPFFNRIIFSEPNFHNNYMYTLFFYILYKQGKPASCGQAG